MADALAPLFARLFGSQAPVRFEFWDGSSLGEAGGRVSAVVRSPEALRRMLWAPGELGLARAFVSGDLDVDSESDDGSSLVELLRLLDGAATRRSRGALQTAVPLVSAARSLGLLSRPPAPPSVEVRLSSRRRPKSLHTKARDAEAVRHHYDIGNDFYRIVLGPAMTYSCARFDSPDATLEEAQASKHEMICRKLGLGEESPKGEPRRLLDVGCGWGSMVIHAASRFNVRAVGVTLSPAQLELATERVEEAGLAGRVELRLQDYRDIRGEQFDAISSVGMFEHVGMSRMDEYFRTLHGLLKPMGRMLNHAISRVGGSRMRGRTFMNRYVFPDGELLDVGDVVVGMERAGFEVRDVESLREHYARTLRGWLSNLAGGWSDALASVGPERARAWRLYMSGSVNAFEQGRIAVHQVLGVRRAEDGTSGMPPTRAGWI